MSVNLTEPVNSFKDKNLNKTIDDYSGLEDKSGLINEFVQIFGLVGVDVIGLIEPDDIEKQLLKFTPAITEGDKVHTIPTESYKVEDLLNYFNEISNKQEKSHLKVVT